MLTKWEAEFPKSRANRSQDQAQVEGKNGAVIRNTYGYGHIAAEHAERLHQCYTTHANPYLNFHRPCGFATVTLDARRERKRVYKAANYQTPYERLKSLPDAAGYLKPGISFDHLEQQPVAAPMQSRSAGSDFQYHLAQERSAVSLLLFDCKMLVGANSEISPLAFLKRQATGSTTR